VLAPFAFIEPFKVAEFAPMEVASFVVADGGPAAIVKVKVLVAVELALSVTLKVKLVAFALEVGVPVMCPTEGSKLKPAVKVPEVISQSV
jgi:hypothetical protein